MISTLVAALAALSLTAGSGVDATNAPPAPTTVGRWAIATRSEDASRVQLRFEYSETEQGRYSNSSWSSGAPIAELGLTVERLRSAIAPVSFQVQREPGTFSCTGSAGEGSGAGQFTYAPSARFDDGLAARGMGRPTYRQSLELAAGGVTLAFVDQIRASMQRAAVGDLVRIVNHGVGPRYIADMRAAGYASPNADALVTLRDHGVTAKFIADLAAAGYKNLTPEELIALRDHGVSVSFVERLKAHGYTNLPVRDLIRLRDSGI